MLTGGGPLINGNSIRSKVIVQSRETSLRALEDEFLVLSK